MNYNNVVKLETKFSNIYVYQYVNGIKKQVKTLIENYFYIKEENKNRIIELFTECEFKYRMYNTDKKSIYGNSLIRVVPNKFQYWQQRKIIWKNNLETFEAKLPEYLKFLLENEVKFTKERRIGIIDIETDRSLDVDNVNEAILSICIYDYKTDKYYVYAWNKNKPCIGRMTKEKELNYYNNEKDMMRNFIKKFKELNLDFVTGWNVENFDFPYLINRMRKIDFNPNELSNFIDKDLQVEVRKIVYNFGKTIFYENTIPGIDVVDMIPVMKKANCYSEQPASFSLDSTVRWYLKDEKKMSIDDDCYEKDFERFIDYNIQDVRLVKLLMDKYELMTFLYSVHLSMANGVPLKHCTHNSIVLIYKLKQDFPNVILPDSKNVFKLDNENIDLNTHNIKIKAAEVLKTNPGIHENVVSFDFQTLYSTIIRTFNISPDTLDEKGEIKIDDIAMGKCLAVDKDKNFNDLDDKDKKYFTKRFTTKKKGIYSEVCEYLMENRIRFKAEMKKAEQTFGKDSFEYKSAAYKSDGQKQVLNSLYGINAYKKFEIYNPFVAAAITSISRKLIKFIEYYCNKKGYKVICGDTDSGYIKIPKDMDEKKLGEELNAEIKKMVLLTWPVRDFYCLNLEHERSFKRFMIKSAKKKYFGIEKNGDLYIKGFTIVQHSTPKKIKIFLQNIFRDLLNQKDVLEIRNKLIEYKKEFKKYGVNDVGIELRLANNPEEYTTNTPHAMAGKYSNKYLGTNFKAGDVGKFVFVKNVGSQKYPVTEYVFLEEDTILPKEFIIDYDKMFKKLVIMPLETLKELDELEIEKIVSQNKMLNEFF